MKIPINPYFLLILPFTLTSFLFDVGLSISISDIAIISLLCISIYKYPSIKISFIGISFIALAVYILNAGIYLEYTQREFYLNSHFTNFLRVILIAAILLIIPNPKIIKLGRIITGLRLVILFHCYFMFFDVVSPNIFDWDGDYITLNTDLDDTLIGRPRGLFIEPAFFAIFMGISLTLVLQYEKNHSNLIFNLRDFLIIVFALILSSSVSALFIAILFIFYYLFLRKGSREGFISALRSSFLLLTLSIMLLIGGAGTILAYSASRISNVVSLEDSSGTTRLLGSTLFSIKVASEKPFTGIGLGGANLGLALDEDFVSRQLIGGNMSNVSYSTATHWAGLITTSGLIGLIIYYLFILGNLVYHPATRVLATGVFVVGIGGGQIFSLFLWMSIAVGILLQNKYEKN